MDDVDGSLPVPLVPIHIQGLHVLCVYLKHMYMAEPQHEIVNISCYFTSDMHVTTRDIILYT